MFAFIFYLILIPFTFFFFYFLTNWWKYREFPPGPRPLPFIGNLLSTGKAPYLVFSKLSKKYGPIVGATMGPEKTIYIHGAELIKDAFTKPEFAGKFVREAGLFLVGDGAGIVQSEGKVWEEQRRFAIRGLREFGFGKTSMESSIQENVNDLVEWLKRQNAKPISIRQRFSLAVGNGLWRIITGIRYNHDDEELFNILNELDRTMKCLFQFDSGKTLLLFYYPKIAKMFPNWSGWNNLAEAAKPRDELFTRIIAEHLKTRVKDEPRDFIDAYLQEINETMDTRSSFHPTVGLNSLKSVMSDLFLAGIETTAVALTWSMLYLINYPRVQKKLQQELDKVVGRDITSQLKHRKDLPYAEAVVMETLRFSSVSAVNLVHQSIESTDFHGYHIPKGTNIFGNLYDSHHDSAIWGDPETFRPERFLSPDGTTILKNEAFIPFSVGKRICPGNSYARDSLFLYITNLVHTFDIYPPEDGVMPSLEYQYGRLTLGPRNSTLVMKERRMNQTSNVPQFISEST